MRCGQASAFYNHKLGVNRAIEEAVAAAVQNGWIMEVKHDKVVEGYNYHGKAWRILELPDFIESTDKKE